MVVEIKKKAKGYLPLAFMVKSKSISRDIALLEAYALVPHAKRVTGHFLYPLYYKPCINGMK